MENRAQRSGLQVYADGRAEMVGSERAFERETAKTLYDRLVAFGCPKSIALRAQQMKQTFETRSARNVAKTESQRQTEHIDEVNRRRAAIIAADIAAGR